MPQATYRVESRSRSSAGPCDTVDSDKVSTGCHPKAATPAASDVTEMTAVAASDSRLATTSLARRTCSLGTGRIRR
jgi:hypothetical protein